MEAAKVQNLLAQALREHQAGRVDQAVSLYQAILAVDPANAPALYLMGVIALARGQASMAVELTARAIAIESGQAGYHFQLGAALQTQGDLVGALASYRSALALQPDNADTYTNMGNTLAAQGKLDEALDCLLRALVLQPKNAVSHCSLGILQWRMGRREEAEASFRQAIAFQPHYVAAVINLGNIHRDKGALGEAEKCYRRAVGFAPQSAAAHGSLGHILWNLARREEAMACYRKALELDPNHVESLGNLGLARWDIGALEDAEAIFTRALALRPHDTDLLNNFADLLIAQGRSEAAMQTLCHSLAVRETSRAKRLFASLARQSGWGGASEDIRSFMVRALTEPWDQPGRLARASAELIKFNPAIGPLIEKAHAAWPKRLTAQELLGDYGFAPLADDALLVALLTSAPNADIQLEHFLTLARAAMLAPQELSDELLRFAAALSQQCWINEYIFLPDDLEMKTAMAAREALTAALETANSVAPMQVLIVASYFPLHSLSKSKRLLERPWPAPVEAVLTQQIREPLEEFRLRSEIPRLTKIENHVSQLVQSQYEKNPYPRWVRLAPESSDNIVSFLSAKFPLAPFERNPRREMRDFLVAGCGTGAQSTSMALKFGDRNLTAVDLSLASLSYARRKSEELGLTIDYGQADILELASLGRQFDVIDCSGVLHHMADPYAGWQALSALLRPNGFMKVGFYSALARRPIAKTRAAIAEKNRGDSADDIREFRQQLMQTHEPDVQTAILNSEDFFSMSACRDLLFHVQEHHVTLPKIRAFLESHGLRFIGFELPGAILDAYRKRFPDDAAAIDLVHWEAFEDEHPDMFARMYDFWVWKAY